ncbi:hypothetical protein MKX01_017087 [Papaver californicum]|nr:hypothetical protein MKX01_017087 [Papaver californicum]
MFKPRFKALGSLVTAMVDVTKCIIEFETLPTQQIKLDYKEISDTKSQIYAATYWVLRSTLTCSSLITDLIAINDQQVHVLSLPSLPSRCINKKLDSNTTSATWELSSLVYKVTRIYRKLRKQVDKCHLQIEDKLHRKLLDLFQKDTHLDNQKVLSTLFSLKDDKPLKDCCSQEKIGVPDLLNKVVVLLISKPEILPLEELLFLVQKTCSNFPSDDKTMRRYEIVWVPIPSSSTWTDEENKVFKHLSDILPWYSIRQPSRVSSAVVNYLKHVSGFVGEPAGQLECHTYGPMAYPFTASREEKLWEEVNWFGQLIADEIDPLLSKQIEEGRICLYGSSDINWIRELSTRIKEVTETGLQLDLIYVGKRRLNDDQHVSNIISTITEEKLSSYLAYPKMHFFWLQMENIKR